MKNPILSFVLLLVVSIGTLLTIERYESEKFSPDKFASRIQKVRSFGLGSNPAEVRGATENPEWLKIELDLLEEELKSGIDSGSRSVLTASQIKELIDLLGEFGPRMSSATSTISTIMQSENFIENTDVLKSSLLALARFKSAPESVDSLLTGFCSSRIGKNPEISTYACIVAARLGISVTDEEKARIDVFEKDFLAFDSVEFNKLKDLSDVAFSELNSLVLPYCFFGKSSIALQDRLLHHMKESGYPTAYRRRLVSCTRDFVFPDSSLEASLGKDSSNPESKESLFGKGNKEVSDGISLANTSNADNIQSLNKILHALSDSMQYDEDLSVRKESLIVLLQSGSELGTQLARGYGHKFIVGEKRPPKIVPHPFKDWAVNSFESTAAEAKKLNKDDEKKEN